MMNALSTIDRMRRAACVGMACMAASAVSCQEKVVSYKPFLTGIEGAKMQTAPVVQPGPAMPGSAGEDGTPSSLVRENPDGTVTLISKSGRQLMSHIQRTLAENERDQFVEQVLSDITRAEYFERGRDPMEAFDVLKKHEQEISKLFSRMPMGEHSPNVLMERLSKNVFRVKVTGQAKKGLDRWTGFDMVLEKGNWRLRWFVA